MRKPFLKYFIPCTKDEIDYTNGRATPLSLNNMHFFSTSSQKASKEFI